MGSLPYATWSDPCNKALQTRRVDWDVPYRIERINIVEFINYLAAKKASAQTRKRKLADPAP